MNLVPVLTALGVLGALGLLFGLALGVVGKKFAVEEDGRVGRVREALGGANCGACGFAGCDAFAAAVVSGKARADGCPAGGSRTARAIAAVMGVTVDDAEPVVARVLCNGTHENAADRYSYEGLSSCRAAVAVSGGPTLCEFGCVGLGDCVDRCKFDAITIADGIAHIDDDKCTGCGACVSACPRGVIGMLKKSSTVVVMCRNKAVGRIARTQCKVACIACGRCEKACPSGAIVVVDGVARIDEATCTRCGACVAVCPTHCIVNFYEPAAEE